jgi:hypothetical protein
MASPWTFGWTQLLTIIGFMLDTAVLTLERPVVSVAGGRPT